MVPGGLLLWLLSSGAAPVVASVRVEAAPADVPRLSRYVEITPGNPLDPAALRHSVELLHATGEFSDVVVESLPGPEGTTVVFRPVPAPRLDEVRVEGDRLLSARSLRKITRLQHREPLWPARLERAARDAALALAERGYLEARVGAEARSAGSQAEAVFSVRAGTRVRVSVVSVEGATRLLSSELRKAARPRPGEPFSRARAERAVETLRRRLVERGHWRAAVELRESYDPRSARVALAFHVDAGPRTEVDFRGARVPGPLRRRVEAILREGRLRGDALEEGGERLEQAFHARGHRTVAVSHFEESRPGGLAAVYVVEPGPLSEVASVSVAGVEGAELEQTLLTRPGEPLQDALLESDARSLTRALEDRGHAGARVDVEVPEGGGLVPVVFRARPGPRTLVAEVKVEPPSPHVAPPRFSLQPGAPYRVRDLALDRNALVAAYRNAGFLQAEVTPEVAFSEDRGEARVSLRVSAGPRTAVDHVVIEGLEQTREQVVRRELLVREGEPLGLQSVLESQRRLGGLGIFQRVNVTEMDPESVEARSLVVSAQEAPRTVIAYGIGYAERDLLRGSAEVTRRNLFGMDRSLTTFARVSFRGSRFLTTYREPYLFGRRQELFVTGFREEEDREGFDFVRFAGLVQTAQRLSPGWSLILRYTYQETDVFSIEVPLDELDRQFRTSTFSGPSTSAVKDTRDDPIDPRRGHFLGADLQLSHAVLGGDSFLKTFVQASSYRSVTPRFLLALNGRLGLARSLGAQGVRLPLPDRFFAGGDYSLRGFKLDTAGPLELTSGGALLPTGGNALVLGSAELRFDMGRLLSAAAFTDVGNVYRLVSDLDLADLRYSAGLGLRYRSALGPLRVDWGYKLNRRPGEDPHHFHFTVGHAF